MTDIHSEAPLGARVLDDGAQFALWAPEATSVGLLLVSDRSAPVTLDMHREADGTWQLFVPGIEPGQLYAYVVDGPWRPEAGQRFNRHKIVLDPYARAISGGVDFRGDIRAFRDDAPQRMDTAESLGSVPLGVVVADTPPPPPIARRRPMSETVIYELHLRGFTKLHPFVPDHLRGSYLGLAYPDVIAYLKDLGVTAVELLPIQHFVSEPFVALKGLRNYWGYNTLGFFAPHAMYKAHGTTGNQVDHCKQMVGALHEAGIEVLLDVVYNHTAEGGVDGPSLAFRGISQHAYYRLGQGGQRDYDVTGCGNSLNTAHPMVRRLVMDSLRYWVTEMGIDGFRFDLATTLFRDEHHHVSPDHPMRALMDDDEVLRDVKLIAEPWDIGPFGYQLGHFGRHWSEWNDRFRDNVRDYWRGHSGGVGELATRLAGSPDVFDRPGRTPQASVNFVTAHDGFTMRDLVSYDVKHNQDNGENNRDGSDANRSWNHGFEGETDDAAIIALRRRQVLNFHATQVLALGTPMLLAGDEFGRTQLGNNNAYCQDSPVSWVSWDVSPEWETVRTKVRDLLALRAEHPVLRGDHYLYHDELRDESDQPLERIDLTWVDHDGRLMGPDAWGDPGRSFLAMYRSDAEEGFLVVFNAAPEACPMTMPGLEMGRTYRVVWTSAEADELGPCTLAPGDEVAIPPRSTTVLHAEVATSAAQLATWRAAATAVDEDPDAAAGR